MNFAIGAKVFSKFCIQNSRVSRSRGWEEESSLVSLSEADSSELRFLIAFILRALIDADEFLTLLPPILKFGLTNCKFETESIDFFFFFSYE